MTEEVPHKDVPAAVRSQEGARLAAVADPFLGGCGSGRQCLRGVVLAPAAVVGCEGLHRGWHPLWMQEGHRCAGGAQGDRSAIISMSCVLFIQNTF